METIIYCMRGTDGSFYYGSTTKTMEKRFSDHKYRAKHMTTMKVYSHFNTLGWDSVSMVEEEFFVAVNRKEQIQRENAYILPNINNPLCLNSHCSALTPELKKERRAISQKKYDDTYREKRKQKSRNHYYKIMYGMTEAEYKG